MLLISQQRAGISSRTEPFTVLESTLLCGTGRPFRSERPVPTSTRMAQTFSASNQRLEKDERLARLRSHAFASQPFC